MERLNLADKHFNGRVNTIFADADTIEHHVREADLLVGAVQVPGRRAPVLVPEELVAAMEPGSVIVDVSIDQGGCVATARPTTHGNPTYVRSGVVHYCVPNMPGAVARTSTMALANVTIGYIERLANLGLARAVRTDPSLAVGVNTHRGAMVHPTVADALGLESAFLDALL
jgi:alanine dehydrogenase